MRTPEERKRDFLRLSELYRKFKDSDMTIDIFLAQAGGIFKESQQGSTYYRNLIAYRSGLRRFHLPASAVREMIRHEGLHARIARKIIQNMVGGAAQLEIAYVLEPLLYRGVFGDATGVAPAVVFPNLVAVIGYSKRRYIEFTDRMLREHPNPSESDKLLVH